MQEGILLEGVMKTAIFNPLPFNGDAEVLRGLKEWREGPEFDAARRPPGDGLMMVHTPMYSRWRSFTGTAPHPVGTKYGSCPGMPGKQKA